MRTEKFWEWFDEFAKPKLGMRAFTFRLIFEHLDRFDRPINILETGCCRHDPAEEVSWKGDGCSTILFDRYVEERHDGTSTICSVDLSEEAVTACRKLVTRAYVRCGDSRDAIRDWVKLGYGCDLLYLDSFDYYTENPIPAAVHHHQELMAAMPLIRPDTLVVVDDAQAMTSDTLRVEVMGKGFLVARHMDLCGAELKFCVYQAGWTNVSPLVALKDEHLITLVERARKHVENDQVMQAEHLYRLILGATSPPTGRTSSVAHGDACAFYARMALSRNKIGEAADWYRQATDSDPPAIDYRLELVMKCLRPMGALTAAMTEAERASRIDPTYDQVWHVLGGIYHDLSDKKGCIEAYDKQLALGRTPDALLDRAHIALDTSDYEMAEDLATEVLQTDRAADGWHVLAMSAYRNHRHEHAIELYQKALEVPGCSNPSTVRWNMSLAMHSIGRYREGWQEHEAREHDKTAPALYLPMKRFNLPRWKGEPPFDGTKTEVVPGAFVEKPKIIHIHAEAGAGDNLALCRYLPLVRDRGYRVRYEAMEEMVDLMRSSLMGVEIVPRAPDYPGSLGVKPFDYHVPIGSLPAIFETKIDSIPWSGSYIKPDPIEVDNYRARLTLAKKGLPRIGFCWSSGIRHHGIWIETYGKRKSMSFDDLWTAADWPSFNYISLQVGPERQQHRGEIIDILPAKPTWSDTAALIANLDLVITVDTSVAHLAGAMGKPVWVMCNRDAASWHFMCWREGAPWNEASPWYPTAKIFRKRSFDDLAWDDVVADVAREIKPWGRKLREEVATQASATA